jgi:hypothetical protein
VQPYTEKIFFPLNAGVTPLFGIRYPLIGIKIAVRIVSAEEQHSRRAAEKYTSGFARVSKIVNNTTLMRHSMTENMLTV